MTCAEWLEGFVPVLSTDTGDYAYRYTLELKNNDEHVAYYVSRYIKGSEGLEYFIGAPRDENRLKVQFIFRTKVTSVKDDPSLALSEYRTTLEELEKVFPEYITGKHSELYRSTHEVPRPTKKD